MVQQINPDYNSLKYPVDALEQQRQLDIQQMESLLKSHDIMGSFFTRRWGYIKQFVRVETYHQDVLFLKHESLSRKVFILLNGEVSAYILTDKTPKPIRIYDFEQNNILTEINALLGGRRHYGFMAATDCKLVSLDLEYIEDEIELFDVYTDLIDILYNESGKRTAELCNIALEQKLDLKDMLRKHNLFSNINNLSEHELNRLADNMKYIFLPANEVLIDEANNKNIYLIEGGTVTQTKSYKELVRENSYIYTRNLSSVYINDNKHNLQEVFASQVEFEKKMNLKDRIDQSKTIHITEDIYRNGIVGEDNLVKLNNVTVTASTKTACCLIEMNIDKLGIGKHGMLEQLIGFFNNKINDIQNKVVLKQRDEVNVKNKYITLVNFSFMFMVIMAVLGLSSKFHVFLDLSSEGALLHHIAVITIICFFLTMLLKPLNFIAADFGLTKNNLRAGLKQALFGIVFMLFVATGLKHIYIVLHAHQYGLKLFQPELVINENLTAFGFYLFIILYIVYIFIYELCARGIIQNIFSLILSNTKVHYWGSIFAAAIVASQFHMSLFHEFSVALFAGNIVAGVIFANTRNLWAVFVFHSVFSVYILAILGLLPSSHF